MVGRRGSTTLTAKYGMYVRVVEFAFCLGLRGSSSFICGWTGRRRSGYPRDHSADVAWAAGPSVSPSRESRTQLNTMLLSRILRASEEGHTESYIVCPAAIVGPGTGPAPCASVFFH